MKTTKIIELMTLVTADLADSEYITDFYKGKTNQLAHFKDTKGREFM